ncbi:MAG: NAD-binding protein [Desulfobacterales bacterium]|nr:NAD-binding protein [Desulfobacterales bacterium]
MFRTFRVWRAWTYLTNETLYDLKELPGSLIILGGGVDGLEYACAFGRLGVKTTVVEIASPRLITRGGRRAGQGH